MADPLNIEVSLSPFDADWGGLVDTAVAADSLGIGGIWMMDHLTGAVHERKHVLECFTVLGGLATATRKARLGTLVVNCGLRHPAVLAQAAATLQQQCGHRFTLGLGAGGGPGTPYSAEMEATGIGDAPAPVRRQRVEETVSVLEHFWGGATPAWAGEQFQIGSAEGFLHPDPSPPLLIAGFGPMMAQLAGRRAATFNTAAGHPRLTELFATARESAITAGRAPVQTSVFDDYDPAWLDPESAPRRRLARAGTDTLILVLRPPFDRQALEAIACGSQAASEGTKVAGTRFGATGQGLRGPNGPRRES